MSDIVDTTEMYIKVIYELLEDGIVAMRARIVDRLQHSGPTVSQTVSRLERDGLLYIDIDRQLRLTEEGMKLAKDIVTKHRYVERFLVDKLDFPWEKAHTEACKIEHVISDEVLSYLKNYIGDVDTDPYGNLIPTEQEITLYGKSIVSVYKNGESLNGLTVLRLGEPVQVKIKILEFCKKLGIVPGAKINIKVNEKDFMIYSESAETPIVLDKNLARHIFVK